MRLAARASDATSYFLVLQISGLWQGIGLLGKKA